MRGRHPVSSPTEGTVSVTDHWIGYGRAWPPGITRPCSLALEVVSVPKLTKAGVVKLTPAAGSLTETVPKHAPRMHVWLSVTVAGRSELSNSVTVPVTFVVSPVWLTEMAPPMTVPEMV